LCVKFLHFFHHHNSTCFSSLRRCQVFDIFTFTYIHLLVFLHLPVFTYWNTGSLLICNVVICKKVYSPLRSNINCKKIKLLKLKLNVCKKFSYVLSGCSSCVYMCLFYWCISLGFFMVLYWCSMCFVGLKVCDCIFPCLCFLYVVVMKSVNIGQCRNTSGQIQVNVKKSNTRWWLNDPKHVTRNAKCMVFHSSYCGNGIK
jgi:hypothetical protein